MLKIFLYLEGRNRDRELLWYQTVGSGLNVEERKCLETTGVMAVYWIDSEDWILDFLLLDLILLFFSYKMGKTLISKLYFANYVFKSLTPLHFLRKIIYEQNKIKPLFSP